MNKNNLNFECLKNLGKEDDYNLGLRIYRQMKINGLANTFDYIELELLLSQYYFGIAAEHDLHAFLKRIGANVLETIN